MHPYQLVINRILWANINTKKPWRDENLRLHYLKQGRSQLNDDQPC